ncbi:MAG: hypothetical protein GTO18_19165 [Anaerolineales bacterium]|nr:hypothetical protein [Anaerolineales bacterium]
MKMRFIVPLAIFVLVLVGGCGRQLQSSTPISPTATSAPPTEIPTETPQPTATKIPATETLPPLSGSGGGRIVFAAKRHEQYEIYVMNADGTDQRRLTNHPAEDTDPVWSPDGSRIAFQSNRTGRFEVFVMNADGSNMRQLTKDGGWGTAWSPDGSMIVFTRFDLASDLFVINADGTNQRRLTHSGEEMSVYGADWSPDGTQMVCVVGLPSTVAYLDAESTIHLLDIPVSLEEAEPPELRPLPRAGERVNDWPSWSPDGSQILFSAFVDGHRGIYVVNADGSNLRRLTPITSANEYAPSWSPDGTQITFQSSAAGGWDIYIMNVDGTGLQQLTTGGDNDVAPKWTR